MAPALPGPSARGGVSARIGRVSQLPAIAERTCAYPPCTETFTPARRDKAYCSDYCRSQASRERNESKRSAYTKPRLRAVQDPLASGNGTRPAWDPPSTPRAAALAHITDPRGRAAAEGPHGRGGSSRAAAAAGVRQGVRRGDRGQGVIMTVSKCAYQQREELFAGQGAQRAGQRHGRPAYPGRVPPVGSLARTAARPRLPGCGPGIGAFGRRSRTADRAA
jgi:hypothetical protein